LTSDMISARLIEEYKPQNARFLRQATNPSGKGNSMHDGTADIFEAVVQWRLKQAGINVNVPSTDILTTLKKQVRKDAPLLYKMLAEGLNLLRTNGRRKEQTRPDFRRITISELPNDKPILVGFGSGWDLLVIWPYLKAIAHEIDGFPLLINRGETFDPNTLRSGLVIDEEFRFLPIKDIHTMTSKFPNVSKMRNICFEALNGGNLFPKSLRNPLLSFQFDFFWDGLILEAIHSVRKATTFFKNYHSILYLDDYCTGVANRAWTAAANVAGIQTVTVPHGALNLLELHDFNACWAFAWGELGRQNWALASPSKWDHVIVCGDPSMEALNNELSKKACRERNLVILLTGGFLHQVWTDMDLDGFISTWETIASIAKVRPAIRFVIKSHPGPLDFGSWYQAFVKKRDISNMEIIDNQKVEELLPSAFLAVLVGKPGTAGIVAISSGVPLVYLDTMLCREVVGYKIWRVENGIRRLTNPNELFELIDLLLINESERNRLLEENQRFLNLYLHPFQPTEICKRIELLSSFSSQ